LWLDGNAGYREVLERQKADDEIDALGFDSVLGER
jgi:hypothetical protein